MAGVVAAGVAGDDVELFAEDVDDLALAFVAPLGSENDGGRTAVSRAARRLVSDWLTRKVAPEVMLGGKCAQRASLKERSRP